MKYEVRDNYNNFLYSTFTSYKEADNYIIELCKFNKYVSKDDIDIVQILTNDDKYKLTYSLINQIMNNLNEIDNANLYLHCYRLCDHNVIDGYDINEFVIKLLIVDKYHEIMLLSYSVKTNDSLEVVEYEQPRHHYLA